MTLLVASRLSKTYPVQRSVLGRVTRQALVVDDVSLGLEAGETLALVGESGAGKSTTGRLILRLIRPDSGTVTFDGRDTSTIERAELRRSLQIVFQDPFGSLDPRKLIGESVGEPLLVHFGATRTERLRAAGDLLERVGLSSETMNRFPRELSGGQLQRVAIARALTLKPRLIVCDEPVAALDVSVRAQVLNLLRDLQDEFGIAYLFITHDLALVEVIADRVAVMAKGRIEELGPVEQIFRNPASKYTRQLLDSIPIPIPKSIRVAPRH